MKTLLKPLAVAGLLLSAAPLAVAPASAQVVAKGIAVVNINAVVANSKAFKTAEEQRPQTYKAQYDAANAKKDQVEAQLKPLYEKIQKDSQAANANQAALQQQATTIQQIQEAGKREIQKIMQPVALSQAYVEEQINDKLADALEAAAKKANVTMVMSPDNVLYADDAYNLNQAVLDQLDAALPYAQLTPPQGWLPRQLREQQAAQQGGQPAGAPADSR